MMKTQTICYLLALMLIGCGTLRKQKTTLKTTDQTERHITEFKSSDEYVALNSWEKSWMQNHNWSITRIQSDSSIVFLPQQGWQISKGSIWIHEANQQQAERQQQGLYSTQKNQKVTLEDELFLETKESKIESDKERHPPNLMIWAVFITAVFILIGKFILRRK